MKNNSLTEQALKTISECGRFALNEASQKIIENPYRKGVVSDALNYYAKIVLQFFQL